MNRWLLLAFLGLSGACAAAAPPAPPPSRTAATSPLPLATPTPASTNPAESDEGHAEASTDAPVAPPPSLDLRELPVPRDRVALVALASPNVDAIIVYLHGRCGDQHAFTAWALAAAHVGSVLSLRGDVPCKGGGRTKWSGSAKLLDARIDRAIDALSAATSRSFDKTRIMVVGYSQGALRGELLANQFPTKYDRVLLIGGPRAPRKGSFHPNQTIGLMAGDHDVRGPLIDAANDLERAGRRARFFVLPDARHGEYGSKPVETMAIALGFITGP